MRSLTLYHASWIYLISSSCWAFASRSRWVVIGWRLGTLCEDIICCCCCWCLQKVFRVASNQSKLYIDITLMRKYLIFRSIANCLCRVCAYQIKKKNTRNEDDEDKRNGMQNFFSLWQNYSNMEFGVHTEAAETGKPRSHTAAVITQQKQNNTCLAHTQIHNHSQYTVCITLILNLNNIKRGMRLLIYWNPFIAYWLSNICLLYLYIKIYTFVFRLINNK